ncbi:death-associated protein kinase 1-like isoform X2 [Oscarella lobularis]|uniref:death-associated protein kinase 1-like isoform X2 n=1 Tax=Oscarella lobularis TaxID=121494 RepID=UPI0033137C60
MEPSNSTEEILEDSCIIDAIHRGDLREVERILATGEASSNAKLRENLYEDERESDDDCGYYSILHLAVYKNDMEIVKCLLDHKADPNSRPNNCFIVRSELIRSGFDFDRLHVNLTPLMIAAIHCGVDMAVWLLQKGASVNLRDAHDRDALCWACVSGNVDLVEFFGVRFGIRCLKISYVTDVYTLAFFACFGGKAVFETLLRSVDKKDYFNDFLARKNLENVSLLHIACWAGHLDLLTSFAANFPTDLYLQDKSKRSLLHYASMSRRKSSTAIMAYLLEEKGFADKVNACDKEGSSPLALAYECSNANSVRLLKRWGAKCLNAKGYSDIELAVIGNNLELLRELASANPGIDKSLLLHLAAENSQKHLPRDTTAVLKFLVETVNVNIDETNEKDETALHVACQNSVWILPVKYLIEAAASLEVRDKDGCTPFLLVCSREFPAECVIRCLFEAKADINAKDDRGKNALHLQAVTCDIATLKLLVTLGVDPSVHDDTGRAPFQSTHGEKRVFLQEKYIHSRFSSLLSDEKVKPGGVKLCLVGNAKVGKTTLLNALQRIGIKPVAEADRTAGVDVYSVLIPVAEGTSEGMLAWDFAGQEEFHGAHAIFFNPTLTIFLLVLDVRKGEALMEQEARFWLAFLKVVCRRVGGEVMKPEVIIIGNKRVEQKTDDWTPSFQLKRIHNTMRIEFEATFNLDHCLEIDCNEEWSFSVNKLRQILKDLKRKCIERAREVPRVCELVREAVVEQMRSKSPDYRLVSSSAFREKISSAIEVEVSRESFNLIVQYLDSIGEIIDLKYRICISSGWLCSNIIGPLLAPSWFPVSVQRNSDGKTTKNDIASALRSFAYEQKKKKSQAQSIDITADDAIEVLLFLELCFLVYGETDVYQIPALSEKLAPIRGWQSKPEMSVYRGSRFRCSDPTDIIPPGVFAVLQCRCSAAEDTCYDRYEIWKGGIYLVKARNSHVVECLVCLRKGDSAIDVIVRCDDQSVRLGGELLSDVQQMMVEVRDKRCPGLPMDWFFLDSNEIGKKCLLTESPESVYTSKSVEGKKLDDVVYALAPSTDYSKVSQLTFHCEPLAPSEALPPVAFPSDGCEVTDGVIRAAAAAGSSRWEDIAIELVDVEDFSQLQGSNKVKLIRAISIWKLKLEKVPQVRHLLSIFKCGGVSRRAIVSNFQERLQF